MSDRDRCEAFDHLRRVIAWEMHAQAGVKRAPEDMPPLIAETLLDYFDVTLRPGVNLAGLD